MGLPNFAKIFDKAGLKTLDTSMDVMDQITSRMAGLEPSASSKDLSFHERRDRAHSVNALMNDSSRKAVRIGNYATPAVGAALMLGGNSASNNGQSTLGTGMKVLGGTLIGLGAGSILSQRGMDVYMRHMPKIGSGNGVVEEAVSMADHGSILNGFGSTKEKQTAKSISEKPSFTHTPFVPGEASAESSSGPWLDLETGNPIPRTTNTSDKLNYIRNRIEKDPTGVSNMLKNYLSAEE